GECISPDRAITTGRLGRRDPRLVSENARRLVEAGVAVAGRRTDAKPCACVESPVVARGSIASRHSFPYSGRVARPAAWGEKPYAAVARASPIVACDCGGKNLARIGGAGNKRGRSRGESGRARARSSSSHARSPRDG